MPATPDTSAKNVARVLRRLNSQLSLLLADKGQGFAERMDIAALADALERQATTPWREREQRAQASIHSDYVAVNLPPELEHFSDLEICQVFAQNALRAAFPEMAPPTGDSR